MALIRSLLFFERYNSVVTESAFVRLAKVSLGYTLFVIAWGAFVRASGSGAGCGDHWPLCEGTLIPATPTLTTLIELFHRATSGVALILVFVTWLRARRVFPTGHLARTGARLSLIFIVIEALIGAVIVRASLFGENASLTRGMVVGAHFVNTLILLGWQTLTIWWARGGAALRWRPGDRVALLLALGMVGWLVLGATGAIGALSRSLYPSNTLVDALAKEFSPASPLLLRLRGLHPLVALLMGTHLVATAWLIWRRGHDVMTQRLAVAMSAVYAAQCSLGLLNVLMVEPTPVLQLSHLVLMDTLWIAYVLLCAQTFAASESVYTPGSGGVPLNGTLKPVPSLR
jgi:heme a synthase